MTDDILEDDVEWPESEYSEFDEAKRKDREVKHWLIDNHDPEFTKLHEGFYEELLVVLKLYPSDRWEGIYNLYRQRSNKTKELVKKQRKRKAVMQAVTPLMFGIMTASILPVDDFLVSKGYLGVRGAVSKFVLYVVEYLPYLIAPGGFVVAVALFALRGFRPLWYGFLEIILGVAIVGLTADKVDLTSIPSVVPFVGGVYFVIRGFDNYAKGLEPRSFAGQLFTQFFNNPPRKP